MALAAFALARREPLALARRLSLATSLAFSYSANDAAIWRIILREGSLLSVRSSPLAVRTRTPRLLSARMPNRQALQSVGNNVLLNHAVSSPLT